MSVREAYFAGRLWISVLRSLDSADSACANQGDSVRGSGPFCFGAASRGPFHFQLAESRPSDRLEAGSLAAGARSPQPAADL